MKKLFKFCWRSWRGGGLEGLFIATQEQVDEVLGWECYFGEALGKHSDVRVTLSEEVFETISSDQDLIKSLERTFALEESWAGVPYSSRTLSGYNPLNRIQETEEDEEDFDEE
jgi:hypothetical protein